MIFTTWHAQLVVVRKSLLALPIQDDQNVSGFHQEWQLANYCSAVARSFFRYELYGGIAESGAAICMVSKGNEDQLREWGREYLDPKPMPRLQCSCCLRKMLDGREAVWNFSAIPLSWLGRFLG